MHTDRSFEFFRLWDAKLETLYPYRKAKVSDFIIEVRGNDVYDAINQLFMQNGQKYVDNHIVFKLNNSPLWFWYTDGTLRIGTNVEVFENGW